MRQGCVLTLTELLDTTRNSLNIDPPSPKFNCRNLNKKLQKTKKLRNKLRKALPSAFPEFLKTVRKTTALKKEISKLRLELDFWRFSKEVCNGPISNEVQCTEDDAVKHFRKSYSDINAVRPSEIPNIAEISHLDHPVLTPISCSDIHIALTLSNLKSAPGLDEISYSDLSNNPECFPSLCKIYNEILETGLAPSQSSGWSSAIISLIFKNKGPTTDIANYRPIAVTSTITRLFHKILTTRLEDHLRETNFFDATVQKGFLKNLHGCLDHSSILQDVTEESLLAGTSAYVTLFDLKDAFGSIPHLLIKNTLLGAQLPTNFINYIINYYNQTEACLRGPWGVSPTFPINQGVLQGDPLSPLLFNMCFNNTINIMSSESRDFRCGNSPSFLAYADDTILITNSAKSHQNLTDLFFSKTSEIALILRPDKSISWKIVDSKIQPHSVKIGKNVSTSLSSKPEKYLGVTQCIGGKSEASNILLNEFRIKCNRLLNFKHISKTIKEKIFKMYLLPSYYFTFMTSDISTQTLESLNEFQNKFSAFNKNETYSIIGIYQKFQILSYIFKLHSDNFVQEAVYRKLERDPGNRFIEIALYLTICSTSLQKARNLFKKIFKLNPKIIDEYPEE